MAYRIPSTWKLTISALKNTKKLPQFWCQSWSKSTSFSAGSILMKFIPSERAQFILVNDIIFWGHGLNLGYRLIVFLQDVHVEFASVQSRVIGSCGVSGSYCRVKIVQIFHSFEVEKCTYCKNLIDYIIISWKIVLTLKFHIVLVCFFLSVIFTHYQIEIKKLTIFRTP